jgi:cell division protein FtsW (lipid II flippase)
MSTGLSDIGGSTRPRTGVAIALTVLALILSIGAYALVGLGKQGTLPLNLLLYGSILIAVSAGEVALIRRFAPTADPVLFPLAVLLAGIGFAMIFRLEGDLATEQFLWMMVGMAGFAGTLLVIRDARVLNTYAYTIGLAGLVLLLLPIVPGLGREINGARLWIHIGPITVQPAEIGKVLIVIFLAGYLDRKKELLRAAPTRIGPLHLPEARHLGPLVAAWGVSLAVLFLEKDLGASLLYFSIFVVMLWVATARTAYLLIGGGLFAVGAFIAFQTFDHVQTRVEIWLHAHDPKFVADTGYQLAQSQFALASGGILGTGFGKGQPGLIPYAATDFIFSAIGEELGLLGATAILLFFVALVGRGFRIALAQRDDFSKLLVTGLSALLGIQAFVIIGGVTRLIPLTGITLPFVSYGGSSLVTNFILLALLVRVSAGPAPRNTSLLPAHGGAV